MPQPDFYPEGTTARITDTRKRTWVKILGAFQNFPGALADNNPRRTDTVKKLKVKVNKALQGVT